MIHFRHDHAHTGWTTTCVDILDKGKVPILFSVEQMRNLRMNIEHTPAGEFLTCPLFGMQRAALAVSTSNHPVLDTMALATSSWKPMYSSQPEEITCAAQHVTVNIVLIQTKKVARSTQSQHMSRNRPRLLQRRAHFT